MPNDAQVIANAIRQAELEKRHRDLTKPVPPIGTDGESLRNVKGFEQISDEMLEERANFNLREHMRKVGATLPAKPPIQSVVDLSSMSPEELRGLAGAAQSELAQKEK